MTNILSATLVSRAKQLIVTELDGDFVSIDTELDACYTFNAITMSAWQTIETPQTFGRICERLGELYDVSETRCREDVARLLLALASDGLVRLDEG